MLGEYCKPIIRNNANYMLKEHQNYFLSNQRSFRKSSVFCHNKKFGKLTTNELVSSRSLICENQGTLDSVYKTESCSVLDQQIWHMKKPGLTNTSLDNIRIFLKAGGHMNSLWKRKNLLGCPLSFFGARLFSVNVFRSVRFVILHHKRIILRYNRPPEASAKPHGRHWDKYVSSSMS